MRISFLGGTDEIGASCLLVEVAGRRIVVDCGVRQGARARDPLPDLALTQAAGGVDAIVVTHAHFDHTGALPVIHGAYQQAPVWCTEPTRQLVGILLRDSLKIMDSRAGSDGDVPLYPEVAVDSLLARMEGHRFLEPEELLPGVQVTFFPAGHILGAASVGFESSEGRLLVSGDISVADQLTVPGMMAPRFRPDALVIESTYGDRLHASREAEERRLVEAAGQVIARGGKLLIPAFAIGRAQEVILILRRAMSKKQLASFPIVVDGMVRSVCGVYSDHPDWLSGALRRKVEKKGNPFWGEDSWVRPVQKPEERATILAGPPCVIVASSGMLTGGASAFYAAHLARDARNMIAITGYQDEESPGRRLLDLAEGRTSTLFIGGQSVDVAATVTKYALSAHADSGEIAGLVDRLRPKDLILVHGHGEARTRLAEKLAVSVRKDIHMPCLGESLDLAYRRAKSAAPPNEAPRSTLSGSASEPAVLDADALRRLTQQIETDPPTRTYSLNDLAVRLLGPIVDRARREEVRRLLTAESSGVVPDPKRPFLYRRKETVTSYDRGGTGGPGRASMEEKAVAHGRDEHGRLEQNEALALVDTLLGRDSGLIRKGAQREGWQLVVAFDFPDVARDRHQSTLRVLEERTGWTVSVYPEANQARLSAQALGAAPAGWTTGRPPGVRREERRVDVYVDPRQPLDATVTGPLGRTFQATTGWTLAFRHDDDALARRPTRNDSGGRVEINQAYEAIRSAFAPRTHAPRKIGLKTDATGSAIEVTFISALVGARYQDLLASLASELGWSVRCAARCDQQEILRVAREVVPSTWTLRKPLGLDTSAALVKVVVTLRPDEAEIQRARESLLESTGFGLDVLV